MIKVKEILNKKGHDFWSVKPDNTIFEALQKMAEKDVGAIMVVENNKLQGIFSERDYARKIVLHGLASKNTKVGDYMTKEVIYVHPGTSINDCMALMTSKRIRHLPVLENDAILGVISIGDVVNTIIQQQHITIQDLENYIYGGRM
jgi:CBS domain-containing protein